MKLEQRYDNLADQLLNDPILLNDQHRFRRKKPSPKRLPSKRIRFDWRDE